MTCACCGAGARLDAETGLCSNCDGYVDMQLEAARAAVEAAARAWYEAETAWGVVGKVWDCPEWIRVLDAKAALFALLMAETEAATHPEAGAAADTAEQFTIRIGEKMWEGGWSAPAPQVTHPEAGGAARAAREEA